MLHWSRAYRGSFYQKSGRSMLIVLLSTTRALRHRLLPWIDNHHGQGARNAFSPKEKKHSRSEQMVLTDSLVS
ncbi:hypothetical protein H113_03347 [Trichophyton rubrum MR1459]|nr:hypothetical protein H113_03347 [Trichophyton rubrum MR1459]EZG07390.1 hypothetical protein H106_03180 [Trichophyton rubrum CBS 735.88]